MEIGLCKSNMITLLIFFLSIIGLAGIYFAVENIKPLDLEISSVEESMIGRLVRINGRIDYIMKSRTGNFYWTVDDGQNITVPILDGKLKKISVKQGDVVEIVGLVSKYNDELEIMPKEINVR